MLTSDELATAARAQVRRATLIALDFSDSDHLRGAFSGLVGHQPKRVVAPHDYGFYSEPLPGASALLVALAGRSDSLQALAFDDPRYRPRQLGAGASAIYDSSGNIIKLVGPNVTMSFVGHAWAVTCKGAIIESDGADITIKAPEHNVYLGVGTYSPVMTAAGPSSQVFAAL